MRKNVLHCRQVCVSGTARRNSLAQLVRTRTDSAECYPHANLKSLLCKQTWTGLTLAVQNEWGGSSSKQKADQLREDIIGEHPAFKNQGLGLQRLAPSYLRFN